MFKTTHMQPTQVVPQDNHTVLPHSGCDFCRIQAATFTENAHTGLGNCPSSATHTTSNLLTQQAVSVAVLKTLVEQHVYISNTTHCMPHKAAMGLGCNQPPTDP